MTIHTSELLTIYNYLSVNATHGLTLRLTLSISQCKELSGVKEQTDHDHHSLNSCLHHLDCGHRDFNIFADNAFNHKLFSKVSLFLELIFYLAHTLTLLWWAKNTIMSVWGREGWSVAVLINHFLNLG